MTKEYNQIKTLLTVKCCAKCPFYEYQDEMMDSSCRADDAVYFGSWKEVDKWKQQRVNDNCPLKRGAIKVRYE